MRSIYLFFLPAVFCFVGCVGPVALKHALPAYDETVSRLQSDSLLINIARTRHKLPTHFTTTTNIAATFDFTTSAGIGANIFIPSGSASTAAGRALNITSIVPIVRASASENPTIGLVPLQGEEYAKRILAPLDDKKFELLLLQGARFDMVMRLMGKGFEFQNPDGSFKKYVRNDPRFPEEYEEFRRIALRLESLSAKSELFVGELYFNQSKSVTLSGAPGASDILQAAESGYEYKTVEGKDNEYELSKRVVGNVAVTNYPPRKQPNEELERLNTIAESTPSNLVQVDIRAGHPGGGSPIFGAIRLRSLNQIFVFLAAGISEKPEYSVDTDPDIGRLPEKDPDAFYASPNPANTLAIVESESPPEYNEDLSVYYRGSYYYVANTIWDREAFNVLYLLFQISTEAVTQRGFPITISK